VFGVGQAIIVGDALNTLAHETLFDETGGAPLEAARRLSAATSAIIAGQAQDMALDRSKHVRLAECLAMEAGKTAALLAQSVAIGAVLAGGEPVAIACLERYGTNLGMSFQAVDDLLGIWGDPAVTGKPVGSDLRSHKKSLPVALAYEAGGPAADMLRRAFAGEMTDDVVEQVSAELDRAGICDEVGRRARAHLEAALGALSGWPFEPAAVAELHELARFVVDRDY